MSWDRAIRETNKRLSRFIVFLGTVAIALILWLIIHIAVRNAPTISESFFSSRIQSTDLYPEASKTIKAIEEVPGQPGLRLLKVEARNGEWAYALFTTDASLTVGDTVMAKFLEYPNDLSLIKNRVGFAERAK